MSNEFEGLRRRVDKLEDGLVKSESNRESDKKIQEANMNTLESRLRELIADNRAASERLGKDLTKTLMTASYAVIGTIVGTAGVATAILALVLNTPGS